MGLSLDSALAHTATEARAARPPQNWVLNPVQDVLLVVAAPLLMLGAALGAFALLGPAAGTSCILLLHVVMTVAHHTPTFIRVYGDVELFRRFKWTFVLGPLVPFTFALGVLTWLNVNGYPVENALYLFILLTIWDPWHFLMQHYGFMRIYDRNNRAPRQIAARMDLAICVSWFVFIMLASGEWLAGLLEDLLRTAHVPLVAALPPAVLGAATDLAFVAAALASVAYGAYLIWCRRHGYYISVAKVALLTTTFGVMFLAYTPNEWIAALAPGWSFPVGFAVLGIVHMTQYLAIVWRYNRSLAARPGRARAGLFRRLHARGGWLIGGAYVALCLAYGGVLTSVHENRWLMSVLLAAGFTSTLMHYYFDGFIWKLRHQQNREQFADSRATGDDAGDARGGGQSWWDASRQRSAPVVLLRQLLYFGVPMAVLTIGALWVWNGPGTDYVARMIRGQALYEQGRHEEALAQAQAALAAMQWQLEGARRVADLKPTAAREAAAAFLVYNHARYAELLIPTLNGRVPDNASLLRYRDAVAEAVLRLAAALRDGGEIAHTGRETIRREDAYATLESWRRELADLGGRIALTAR